MVRENEKPVSGPDKMELKRRNFPAEDHYRMVVDNYNLDDINQLMQDVARGPGVYLMKDASGKIIYVGKAANLYKRLSSYFGKTAGQSPKTAALVARVNSFETILTGTEKEALILESNLIKKYRPRYNVMLKDDKRYPSLRLDPGSSFPNLVVVRKVKDDGAMYFGPYASAKAVRQTVRFIHKTFKLRKCNDKLFRRRTRPCLNYQMSLCLGPCCRKVDSGVYQEIVKEVIAFLRGRTPELIRKVKRHMLDAAARQDFEQAADLRDKLFGLRKTLERQAAVINDFKDRDVIALAEEGPWTVLTLLRVRSGFLLGKTHFDLENSLEETGVKLSAFVRQYYTTAERLPGEVLFSHRPGDKDLLVEHIKATMGKKVKFLVPRKAEKRRLVEMALANAKTHLQGLRRGDHERHELLRSLQQKLRLDRLPQRIECFDNSHLAGRQMVSAMAVFINGRAARDEFRRFRLNLKEPDDYQAMALALHRRFSKVGRSELPDLVLVDGGKGQLQVAVKILSQLGLDGKFSLAGIAKGKSRSSGQDKIYLPGRSNPVNIQSRQELMLFLQRIRDQAHLLAVGYHRLRHRKEGIESVLDRIAAIGPKRKAVLLQEFGSIEKIRAATLEELSALPGISVKLAAVILEALEELH